MKDDERLRHCAPVANSTTVRRMTLRRGVATSASLLSILLIIACSTGAPSATAPSRESMVAISRCKTAMENNGALFSADVATDLSAGKSDHLNAVKTACDEARLQLQADNAPKGKNPVNRATLAVASIQLAIDTALKDMRTSPNTQQATLAVLSQKVQRFIDYNDFSKPVVGIP